MKKKFQFKLEALLKLKSFNESKLRAELGEIVTNIESTKKDILLRKEEIQTSYVEQEKIMADGSNGQLLKFFPYFIEGKKEAIKALDNKLYSLEKKYKDKLKDLSLAMGESKMVSNLKEKHKIEHNKKNDKKIHEESEESFQSRAQFLKFHSKEQ